MTGDGITNIAKIKMGVNVHTYVGGDALGLMPQYSSTNTPNNAGCYDLTISNIALVATKKGNMLHVTAMEDGQNPYRRNPRSGPPSSRASDLPPTVTGGSIVLVTDGIHGQYVDGTNIPLVILGGSGS